MRVIAGKYRGRILRGPSDGKTRPTSDRLRETLFNILSPRIRPETRFLDLCAGTGAVGIEALSRGATFATFVDKSRRSCALIEQNLDSLKIPENQTDVVCLAAENFVGRDHELPWDIAFFDPPYSANYLAVLYEFGGKKPILDEEGILIVEHYAKNPIPESTGRIRRWRELKQGETILSFYERK